MSKSNYSEIWTYFTPICDAERAKCKLCNKEYSRKGRTTTAMRNHLKAMHKTEFSKLEECEKRKQDASKSLEQASSSHQIKSFMKQISFQECVDKTKQWDNNSAKSLEVDNFISEMVALEDLPFRFVESVGFVRLIKHLCPSYNLKSRQYFTSFICDKLFCKVSEKILQLLKSFEKLSFTTDIWSDTCSGVSLLSLTCHGITKEFERKMIVLKAEVFNEGRHTGENIAHKLEDILSFWEIPKDKVKCVVRDARANMKKGVNLLNVEHIDCASHKIQNVLKAGMKAQETVVSAITKCKKMATHFHHSTSAQDELTSIQKRLNQKPLKTIQECTTRWNSTFYMLERILQVKESLCLYASANNKIPQLASDEWMIIEKLIGLLRPFEEITKELSASDVSISSVIPLITTLEKVVHDLDSSDEHIGDTITVLKDELIRKFSGLENEILFSTATFIDPRYKSKFFKNTSTKERVIEHILDLLGDSQTDISCNSSYPNAKRIKLNQSEDHETRNSLSLKEKMSLLMDTSDSEDDMPLLSFQNPVHLLIRKTLTEYSLEKRVAGDVDPLTWWKVNKGSLLLIIFMQENAFSQEYVDPKIVSTPNAKLLYLTVALAIWKTIPCVE
ncbi:zinc finger BED domain-containing protein 4-like [Diabrotica virgifera virgifera]|uniref:BED-type domain-containing protein n=1 Tax=Diabrotica virgifera virgifera TaxID=50390 RepID=A0ABM5KCX1_DIAVI|nr:zinc finger BED domain-containing protein 4-like [Diabrotica virgifera virgifera]